MAEVVAEGTGNLPIVYCRRGDRMATRLRNLLSAMCFAQTLDTKLILIWPESGRMIGADSIITDDTTHDFFQLFDRELIAQAIPWLEISDHDPVLTRDKDLQSLPRISSLGNRSVDEIKANNLKEIFYDITSPYSFTNLPVNRHQLLEAFHRLPLHPKILSALGEVTNKTRITNGVALHVRRGDIMAITKIEAKSVGSLDKVRRMQIAHFATKYAPYDAYMQAIRSIQEIEAGVAVFSDDPNVKKRFKRDLGENYIEYDETIDGLSLTPCQIDFVEFLLISRSAYSFGAKSSFIELAALLGKNKYQRITKFVTTESILRSLDYYYEDFGKSANELRSQILSEFAKVFENEGMHTEAESAARIALAGR